MQRAKQLSESLELGIILALAGGFMDAYSYICRGHVFANAQTGNILLIGVNLSEGNWQTAVRYLFPVFAFTFGIGVADIVRLKLKYNKTMHWRQIAIFFEIVILYIVSFMPQNLNLLANSFTSFACGIQVESFRKINGNGIATTMCIGNLRTATQSVCEYWHTKDKFLAEKGILFFSIIFFFVIGAVIGNRCVEIFQEAAIRLCDLFLLAGMMLMFIDREEKEKHH